jgi:hypothetical protein
VLEQEITRKIDKISRIHPRKFFFIPDLH